MNNFLEFINKDIDAKRLLISSMPIKTKPNQKKLNKTISEFEKKYNEYKNSVKTYLLAKNHSLEVKSKNHEDEEENLVSLEQTKFLLNPTNTYFEKLGFDELLYQINHYNVFNFNSLNDIINGFLDKFEFIGIRLDKKDFDYNSYVQEYMSAFLDVRYGIHKKYDKVSEVFEKIYWVNPDLITHLGLNFRKLIRNNESKFISYIDKLQKTTKAEKGINDYEDCLSKLKNAHSKLNLAIDGEVENILELATSGQIDINHYLPGNKVRESAFTSLLSADFDIENQKEYDKVCEILLKLKYSLEEYTNYLKFVPLFDMFKNEYQSYIDKKDEKPKDVELEALIVKKEKELEKQNAKIRKPRGLFGFRSESALQLAKMKSNHLIREIADLYVEYDQEYFKNIIRKYVNSDMTVLEVIHLYYSFGYYKKTAIQAAYELETYDAIMEYSNEFDLYSMNPNNLIAEGIEIFNKSNVSEVIANKYKLNNINIEASDVSEENLKTLLNKVLIILRLNVINNSKMTLDEIWFMVQVAKIVEKEKQGEE